MDIVHNILYGFSIVLQPGSLLFCFLGVLIGTLIGVLPGIGPSATVAILLPVSIGMSAADAMILLAGIYYGSMYGGSTTSILVNIPGESASVVTCIDGYQMARQGRAGVALGMSAFGSFIGGTIGVLGLMLLAPPLAEFALQFGPPEYFAMILCGFSILIYIGSGSRLKALLIIFLGLFLGQIGNDLVTGESRFTFGNLTLMDGVPLVPMVMGLFGIAEVLTNLESTFERILFTTRVKNLLPNLADWKASLGPIGRGTILGFFLGLLPGGSATLSSFASYAVEKRISKHPEQFGKGAIEGVAGPETANNAATSSAFIPMLTLGIPANPVMALVLAALLCHGLQPGPLLLTKSPDVFWAIITSMYVGNVMLVVLNLPLIAIWVKLLKVPYAVLFPLILLFCLIGSYSTSSNYQEIMIMTIFGVIGYLMRKFEYDPVPLVFAFILTPLLERAFRQSLAMSNGGFLIFLRPPIALVLMITAFILIALLVLPLIKKGLSKTDGLHG
ncbi:MAG: tripartite tricarboxylate transporter permease [Deltaproteobacteria bacterium]|nr:tripartite tricarboxylate transporter permease [Deltaproteobacteria bacterium]